MELHATSHDIENCVDESSCDGSTWEDHPESGNDLGPFVRNQKSKS
jgi:hypothetical protein